MSHLSLLAAPVWGLFGLFLLSGDMDCGWEFPVEIIPWSLPDVAKMLYLL